MTSSVEIMLSGGPADGEPVTVELDTNGRPPLTHHHLVDDDLAGAHIYELESAIGNEPPWIYRYRGPAT